MIKDKCISENSHYSRPLVQLFSGKLADAIVDDVWDVANIACEQVPL